MLAEGYGQMIDAYLVTEKMAPGLEQAADQILHDYIGELHQRYEAEQGGLVLISSGMVCCSPFAVSD